MSTQSVPAGSDAHRGHCEERLSWGWLVLFLAVVIALWLVGAALVWHSFDKPEARGQFGDMLGCVNSLFSGLAFAGFLFAILLQMEQLRHQRKGLEDTRLQFRTQIDRLESQTRTVAQQAFEDTFFRMLELLDRERDHFTVPWGPHGDPMVGNAAFEAWNMKFQRAYKELPDEAHVTQGRFRHCQAFDQILRSSPHMLRYLGVLVHTLSLLDKSQVQDKGFNGTLLSSQLGQHEKCMVFYYGLMPGIAGTKRRIENYSVLCGIERSQLIERSHSQLYDERAWTPVNEAV